MQQTVILNDDLKINATNLYTEDVVDFQSGKKRKTIHVDFKVTSEDYHRVATFLYKNDFDVKVPTLNLQFPAYIQKYTTSVTNLYRENQVGDYSLTLIEKGD
ncbi:DUF3219 family protein [Allobacillus sp. GCM10007491]|uniref:DUF3219 family protein n=1 Tax=Allobacillus saliphilus TaxID=2912308 RepID=A0A941HT34_9BACI|nr:DUF3219 family protein [Allobacillus saliphilus]MBR7553552.1 DUF3219 family protein [Allobacillus saliphilus]